jgi:hypothetical protein
MQNLEQYILDQYAKNRSANSIGKELGKNHHFVLNILRINGIKIRQKQDAHKSPYPYEETDLKFQGEKVYRSIKSGRLFFFYKYRGRNIRKTLEVFKCDCCSKDLICNKNIRQKKHFCSQECKSKMNSGPLNHNWKGFIKKRKSSGHNLQYAPEHPKAKNNFVYEHRLIVEKHLGRILEDNEFVHHINGIKDDNRFSNLVVCSASEHTKAHNSLLLIAAPLIEKGIIKFDLNEKVYKLC